MKIPTSKDDISSYVERQNTIETYFCLLMLFSFIIKHLNLSWHYRFIPGIVLKLDESFLNTPQQ